MCYSTKFGLLNPFFQMSWMCNVFNFLQVFPVSKKVHTTRCKAQGVVTFEDTQLVSFQRCRNDLPEAAGSASQIAKDFLICMSYKINHADVSSSFATGCRQTDRICFFFLPRSFWTRLASPVP